MHYIMLHQQLQQNVSLRPGYSLYHKCGKFMTNIDY